MAWLLGTMFLAWLFWPESVVVVEVYHIDEGGN